jgi:hypothetical protein
MMPSARIPPVYRILLAAFTMLAGFTEMGGCATGGGAPAGSGPHGELTAADYYPLVTGWKWAYDVEKDGLNILATYAVLERSGDVAVVQAGDERLTYAITPEGIAQKELDAVGDFIIKNPVRPGSEWSVAGGRAKIVSVDERLALEPAGQFANCLVVEVTRSDPMRVARTTYAPGVGWVALELQVQEGQRFVTTTRAHLRAVTKPGEDQFH